MDCRPWKRGRRGINGEVIHLSLRIFPLLTFCSMSSSSLKAVQYAKAMGLRVLAIDAGEKEALCAELGAEAFIDFKTCKE